MEVYAATGLRVLLEDFLKQLQPEATHRQRPHPIPGRCMHHVREGAIFSLQTQSVNFILLLIFILDVTGGEEQMVSKEAPCHSPWSPSQKSKGVSG